MAIQPDLVGTITLTSGSTAFTWTGTSLIGAAIRPGDEIRLPGKAMVLTIATVASATTGTLTDNCPAAAAGSGQAARVRYQSDLSRVAAQTRQLIELLSGRGFFKYDAAGSLAERDDYDARPQGFAYLNIDTDPMTLYVKASDDSGDWAGPVSYATGLTGPAPNMSVGTTDTGAAGTDADVTIDGTNPNYTLNFTIPRGDTGAQGPLGPAGFRVSAVGELADRATYDAEDAGFSFVATDGDGVSITEPVVFVKLSSASADWSDAVAFGASAIGSMAESVYDADEIGMDVFGGGIRTATRAALASSAVAASVDYVQTVGYAAAGDGGGALYKRVGSEPAHGLKVQSGDGAWWEIAEEVVAAEMAGAVGDGDGAGGGTNNATAIQSAMDAVASKGGGTVTLGNGTFLCAGVLSIPSNVTLKGAGRGATKLDPGSVSAATWIGFVGTFGSEINLSGDYARGATSITVASAHGLAVDDIILIKSQRNANSSDAGASWQLGGDNQAVFFGEFIAIAAVPTTTSFTSASPLIFPSYRDDDTLETNPDARPSSTIAKMNPCQFAALSDMTLINGSGVSAMVRGTAAHGCRVSRVDFEMLDLTGYAVVWRNSLNSYAEDCRSYHDADTDFGASFFNYNDFVVSGSQNSGFYTCYSECGSQAFDLTFETGGIPHVNCFIINCSTLWNRWTPATTHPGGFGAIITGNRFLQNARSGIAIRSRGTIFTGNLLIAALASVSDSYGVSLREGWARGCVIEGNYINGFDKGITIHDSGAGANFDVMNIAIRGNTIVNAVDGIWRVRSASNTSTANTGLAIDGNTIVAGNRAIDIDGSHGIGIKNNHIRGPLAVGGIRLQNANDCVVQGNEFDDLGAGIIPVLIASTCARWVESNNRVRGDAANNSTPSSVPSALSWVNNQGHASLYLADDTAISFPIPSNHAVVMLSGFRTAMNGAGACQSAAATKLYGNASFAVSTSVLTGTTGVDGEVTVSATGGRVYVENRSGNADTMGLIVMASAA